jgi:hypothetical protein
MKDEKAGIHHRLAHQRYVGQHVLGLVDSRRRIDIASERSSDALEPVKQGLAGEILGSVEAHVLEEVGETVLVWSLLDGTDVGGEVELGAVGRFLIVHDVVSQPVVELSLAYGRIVWKLLHLPLGDDRDGGQHKGNGKCYDFSHVDWELLLF